MPAFIPNLTSHQILDIYHRVDEYCLHDLQGDLRFLDFVMQVPKNLLHKDIEELYSLFLQHLSA